MRQIFCWLILIFLLTDFAVAKEVTIEEVLLEILDNSNAKKSAKYSFEASQKEIKKSEKHWLPTLYLDSSAFETNDPTQNFIGNLYQRSVKQADFDPSAINKTASSKFSKSSIGINLPLYQGGSGVAYQKMTQNLSKSKKYLLMQAELEQYLATSSAYIALVSLEDQRVRLKKIAKNIDNILKKYDLRDEKNQIGYSGYLILEASKNKTQSFIFDNLEKSKALYETLGEMGFSSDKIWEVKKLPINYYIDKYLKLEPNQQPSFNALALKSEIDGVKNREKIDNSNNLPQINLFAENYVFSGDRATKNGYVAGLNMRWNFFDPFSFNNLSIAKDKTSASRYQYLAQDQNEKIAIKKLDSQINSLVRALDLAQENDNLMFKNVLVSQDLFKSGTISASNLSDAIMKYLDNFVYLANSQMQLIELYAQKLSFQAIDINNAIKK